MSRNGDCIWKYRTKSLPGEGRIGKRPRLLRAGGTDCFSIMCSRLIRESISISWSAKAGQPYPATRIEPKLRSLDPRAPHEHLEDLAGSEEVVKIQISTFLRVIQCSCRTQKRRAFAGYSSSSSFSASTSFARERYQSGWFVGSIDHSFFDHKTAYQRPRTRTTTTRTIRGAEESGAG